MISYISGDVINVKDIITLQGNVKIRNVVGSVLAQTIKPLNASTKINQQMTKLLSFPVLTVKMQKREISLTLHTHLFAVCIDMSKPYSKNQ